MKKVSGTFLGIFLAGIMTAGAVSAAAVSASAEDISGYSAQEVCRDMGIGWNLGNSLDSTGVSGLGSETCWGNPKTTKAMIDAVKAKGFESVRIPVSWGNHMDSNYTVDEVWMDRVQEVVDYCIDDGMYVILNSHHDQWNRPTDANYTAASKELKILWKQIAERFEGYDKHLVFEGMNEPRNYSGENEWNGGTDEMRNVVNKLNADFVSAVRATGGNNTDRALMIPTYAASIEYTAMTALELPDDDNIIVSLHAYSPYNFCMSTGEGSTSEFTASVEDELDAIMENISKVFISKGVPVCIGEFSSSNKYNTAERVKWAKYYAAKVKELGMACMLWDNNVITYTSNGESHGYLNRSSCTWYSESEPVADALISSYKNTSMNLPEIVTVPDLSSAECTVISGNTATVTGYDPSSAVRFDFSGMDKKSVIAIRYSTPAAPTLILQDGGWKVWCKITPTITDKGVAYYSYADIVKGYAAAYQSAYGSAPQSDLYNAIQLFVSAEGSTVTYSEILYAKLSSEKKISDCTVTIAASGAGYTGSAITPPVTVKYSNTTLVKDTDYTLSYANNVNKGTASVTVTGKESYKGSVTKSFTISARDMKNCTVTLGAEKRYFSGVRAKPVVTVKIGGRTVDPSNYTAVYSDNLFVGTAKVTVTGKNNLSGSVVKTFEIVSRNIGNCDVVLGSESSYFNGVRIKPVVKVSVGGTELYKGNYTVVYSNNLSVGTATVKITGKNNLSGSVTKTFKIVQRSIANCDISLTADPDDPDKPDVTVKIGDNVIYKGNYTAVYNKSSDGMITVKLTGKNNLKGTTSVVHKR